MDPARPPRLVIGYSGEALARAIERAASRGPVLVLTEDRDAIPAREGLTVIEPHDLEVDGIGPFGPAWDAALGPWLERIFPSKELAELMRTEVQGLPTFRWRLKAAAAAARFYAAHAPGAVEVVGEVPSHFAAIVAEARRRGLLIAGPGARLREALRWPLALSVAGGLLVSTSARYVRRVARRRGIASRLMPRSPIGGEAPRIWLAVSPRWGQLRRHLWEALAVPFDRRGASYGVLFAGNYGDGEGEPSDEEALFEPRDAGSGTGPGPGHALCRPRAIDQIVGADAWPDALGVWARWAPLAVFTAVRAVRHADGLRVQGIAAAAREDWRPLLAPAFNGLLRVLDAEAATRRFLRDCPRPGLVVFGYGAPAEVRVADELLQRAGAVTVDVAHGCASDFNFRSHWRSGSTYHLSWTLPEAAQFASLGTNRRCLGGFMPPRLATRRARGGRPRIVVATNYLHPGHIVDGRASTLRQVRALAAAVEHLVGQLEGRAEVVLRPHPLEDRAAWMALFARHRPLLSDRASFADDLADAQVLVATRSSVVIEALCFELPILIHRGLPVEPGTIFEAVAAERWFSTGDELCARVAALLDGPADLTPERGLLESCFGPSRRPADLTRFIEQMGQALARGERPEGSEGVARPYPA